MVAVVLEAVLIKMVPIVVPLPQAVEQQAEQAQQTLVAVVVAERILATTAEQVALEFVS